MKISKEQEEKLAEQYIRQRGFLKKKGFAINTQEMNPEDYEEIMYEGESLNKAIEDFVRKTEWWSYEPSDGVQIFEDIWDAVEYAEESSDVSFDDFKKSRYS